MDTYTSLKKQYGILELVLKFYHESQQALAAGAAVNDIFAMDTREKIARAKYVEEDEFEAYAAATAQELEDEMKALTNKEVSAS